MATTQAVSAPPTAQPQMPYTEDAGEIANRQALVPACPTLKAGNTTAFAATILRLPVELDVAVPVREFRVHNLLALAPGQLIESQWGNGDDVPLATADVQLAWSEFEVIDSQLAVRITRLA